MRPENNPAHDSLGHHARESEAYAIDNEQSATAVFKLAGKIAAAGLGIALLFHGCSAYFSNDNQNGCEEARAVAASTGESTGNLSFKNDRGITIQC